MRVMVTTASLKRDENAEKLINSLNLHILCHLMPPLWYRSRHFVTALKKQQD